jgi:hypothetical protein
MDASPILLLVAAIDLSLHSRPLWAQFTDFQSGSKNI